MIIRCMQQLLGNKANSIDQSFLHELFLQQLPANNRLSASTTKVLEMMFIKLMPIPLFQVGKRSVQLLAATSTDQQQSRLFYVTNKCSRFRFLVDTSAEASVIPPAPTERKHRQERSGLQGVNRTPIVTYGS